ncbi:hypothetical protein QTN25_004455 [Entamoeba marina]
MSLQVKQKQPKEKSNENNKRNAEIKQKSLASIHRRIICISWILMKSFGYAIEINKEKRKSKLSFPYYLVSKIISNEGTILFNSNKLSEEFQKQMNYKGKKQTETNWIKKMLNNRLIELLKSLGFFVKTKSSNEVKNEVLKGLDAKTTLKIDYICCDGMKYDMELVENFIGDEANETLKDFFKNNSDVKCATFYLNNNNIVESYFEKNNQYITIPTQINPAEQLLNIQSTPVNENLYSTECSQQPSCVNNIIETVEQEQNGIENVTQINTVNVVDESNVPYQQIYLNEMYIQKNNTFPSYYCNNGVMYVLTPISYNPNNFYPFELNGYDQQITNSFEENHFNDGLVQSHVYDQQNLTQNYSF